MNLWEEFKKEFLVKRLHVSKLIVLLHSFKNKNYARNFKILWNHNLYVVERPQSATYSCKLWRL